MTALYPWLVLLHVVGLLLFVGAHAISMWTAFGVRARPDRLAVVGLLAASLIATRVAYLGLLLLGVGGVGAATIAGVWTTPWVLGTTAVLVAVLVVMYAVASPYYMGLREAIDGNPKKGIEPLTDEQLAARLVSRRPEILAITGGAGLLLMVALMVLRPA